MEKRPNLISSFIVIFRPLLILAAVLAYMLGLGIAHHLVVPIDATNVSLGFVIILFLLEMRAFLEAYYRHPAAPENRLSNTIKVDDPYISAVEQFPRPLLLYVAAVLLAAAALLAMSLARKDALPPSVWVMLVIMFLFCFFSSVPPIALSERGYSEIIEAFLIANAVPTVALGMQVPELHVLLILLTLPLTLLYLALRITIALQSYGKDSLRNRQTMLVRLGLERGMNLHNISLIGCYLLIGLFAAFRLPWALIWPQLLSLPIAVAQFLQIVQIASGAKPNWRLLILTASATFALTAYMTALTLWIR